MSKNTLSAGNSVFGQLISMLPRSAINRVIKEQQSDRYTKKFKTWDHLTVMLFGALSNCSSLREIESGIAGFSTKLLHLGLGCLPKRSTLSDSNNNRPASVFEAIFKAAYHQLQPLLPDSCPNNQKWMQKLFLVDSTTITLFKQIMKACGRKPANGKRKGGVKIHVGMQLSEGTPSLVRITSAATNDKTFMSRFKDVNPQTILVFDKAYLNYNLYNYWTEREVTFVTRLHGRSVVEVLEDMEVSAEEQKQGVQQAQIIYLGHANQQEKVKCRLITLYNQEKEQTLKFITNDFKFKPSEIASIYKQRWQIELLFKRLKQNLQLSDFIGDNENAIRIQIWCNLIADLLLSVSRKGLKKAYSNVASLVRIHLMNYARVKELLRNSGDPSIFNTTKQRNFQPLNSS